MYNFVRCGQIHIHKIKTICISKAMYETAWFTTQHIAKLLVSVLKIDGKWILRILLIFISFKNLSYVYRQFSHFFVIYLCLSILSVVCLFFSIILFFHTIINIGYLYMVNVASLSLSFVFWLHIAFFHAKNFLFNFKLLIF